MFSKLNSVRNSKGFTLLETLVAIFIFTTVITLSITLFTNAFSGSRRIEVSRMLYEETRIALERIVKEVRRGTIDYEEYWSRNQNGENESGDNNYGKNYGEYSAEFFLGNLADPEATNLTAEEIDRYSENLGVGPDALDDYMQDETEGELYLITSNGSEKTIFRSEIIAGETESRLYMLKLNGADSDGDLITDLWSPASDYVDGVEYVFQKIQPDSIKITDLKFFISPLKDPRKAFAEFTDDVQIQPHVTILLTTEPSYEKSRGIKGTTPSITLQTTISARAQNEVKSIGF